MKFTLSWLKAHLDTNASLDDISKTLTAIGLEVESITDRAESLKPFTVAKIIAAEKHPEADKLRVCKVQSDVGELQIVCGAPNARAGIYVALAKEGALIPRDNFVIKKTKIRGVESSGMLCSADELGLGTDSAGIIELPESPIGSPIAGALGLNDPVIEIAITPNRADCLGVRGIARDLAAAGIGNLLPLEGGGSRWGSAHLRTAGTNGEQTPTQPSPFQGEGFKSPINVTIETPACPQFIGAYIKGVKNGESPAWLKQRLEAIGLRPISALVDITNYFTFDLARPLHVYDAKKLKGNLTIRAAHDGEPLEALDGKHYELREGMCVIADESGAVALGGVIGGAPTGCDEHTTDVFLEVALFDPVHVAQNGRTLQINSDARYRFERGLDAAFVEEGAKMAISLITQLCGGEPSALTLAGKTPDWKRTLPFNPERVKTLGGVDVPTDKCFSILESLGFTKHDAQSTKHITPPSWRPDIEGEADLVEEILRIHGYDNIPATPLPKLPAIGRPAINAMQKRAHLARRLLASRGFMECCTWSFLPAAHAKIFGGNNPALTLLNPISADLDTMRPNLLPNLLEAAKKNAFRGIHDVALCEVGLQFTDVTPTGQRMIAAGIRSGRLRDVAHLDGLFTQSTSKFTAFDIKADALALLATLGMLKADVTADTPPWYHPGRSGALTLGGKIILGYFGEIHPAICKQFDLEWPVVAFEIFLDAIPASRAKGKAKPALKLSDYQAAERDFAFTVDEKTPVSDIERAIRAADKTLITDVMIFDVYVGKNVEAGKKSVAVKVTLQSMERTLTEDDINGVNRAILAAAGKFGGVLRQ